jgi:hypothetical protein
MSRTPRIPPRPRGPTGDLPRATLRLTLGGHSASRAGPPPIGYGDGASSPKRVQTKISAGLSQA